MIIKVAHSVRTGGSRHPGWAALPRKNIHVELPIPAALPTAMPSADSCDVKQAAVLRNSRGLVLEVYNHTSADIIRSILEVLVHAE